MKESTAPRFLPEATMLLATFAYFLPEGFLWRGWPIAPYPLVVCIYWRIYAPEWSGTGFLFFNGLLMDYMGGTPLGVWSICFLASSAVLSYAGERRFGDFPYVIGAITGVFFLWWGLSSLARGNALPFSSLWKHVVSTILLYYSLKCCTLMIKGKKSRGVRLRE